MQRFGFTLVLFLSFLTFQFSYAQKNQDITNRITRNFAITLKSFTSGFGNIKSDLVSTEADGTRIYKVKQQGNEHEIVDAASQFIMVTKDGASFYIASYTGGLDIVDLALFAFMRYSLELKTVDNSYQLYKNKTRSEGDLDVYDISSNGLVIARYTQDFGRTEGNLVVGFLPE